MDWQERYEEAKGNMYVYFKNSDVLVMDNFSNDIDAIVAEAVRQAGERTREGDREVTNLVLDAHKRATVIEGRIVALEKIGAMGDHDMGVCTARADRCIDRYDALKDRIAALEQLEPVTEAVTYGTWCEVGRDWVCDCEAWKSTCHPDGFHVSSSILICPACKETQCPPLPTPLEPQAVQYGRLRIWQCKCGPHGHYWYIKSCGRCGYQRPPMEVTE